MKYYECGSLRDFIDYEPLYLLDKYVIANCIVYGLREIHNLNFVHSDLKASNILCENDSINFIYIFYF